MSLEWIIGLVVSELVLSLIACGVAGAGFFRTTPARMRRKVDELEGLVGDAVTTVERIESRVTGHLEELGELHDRIETKRRRTQKIAERNTDGGQPDVLGQAIATARAAGWRV